MDANEEYLRMTGRGDLLSIKDISILDWATEHDRGKLRTALNTVLRDGVLTGLTIDYIHPQNVITTIVHAAFALASHDSPIIVALCWPKETARPVEADLRRKAVEWDYAMDFIEDAICLIDLDDRVTRANQSFYRFTGFSRSEVIGKNFAELIHPPENSVSCPACAARRERRNIDIVMENNHPDNPFRRPIQVMVRIIRDDQGAPVGVLNAIRDLSSQEELRMAKERLEAIFNASPDMIFVHDADGRIVDVNENMLRRYGYTLEEVRNLPVSALSPDGYTAEAAREKIRQALAGGEPDFPWLARTKSGEVFPVEVRLRSISYHGRDGTAQTGVLAVVRDISERVQAEERIERYAKSLRKLQEVSTAITATTDLKRLYRSVITAARDLLALDYSTLMLLSDDEQYLVIKDTIGFPESMIESFRLVEGQGLSTYVVQNQRSAVVQDFRAESRFIVPQVVFDHGITSGAAVPMMLENRMMGVLIGHTRSPRIFTPDEMSLYESMANQAAVAIQNSQHLSSLLDAERKYRKLMESAQDAIFVADAETGVIIDANRKAGELLGLPPVRIVGMHQSQLHPPGEAERYRKIFAEHVRHEQALSEEVLLYTADGRSIPVEIGASTAVVGGRRIIQGIFRDIRPRMKAQAEQRQLTALIENSADFIGMATPAGTTFYINRAGRELVGLSDGEDVRRMQMQAFVVEEDRGKLREIVDDVLKNHRDWKGELRFRHMKTERAIPVEMNIFGVSDPHTGSILAVATISRDVSDRKRLEEELIKAQKLESLGVLAGGIAHDFNNLLAAIMGNIIMANMQINDAVKASQFLKEAELASERARDLTQQLLTFSRGGLPVKTVLTLDTIIQEAAAFALRGAQAHCSISLPPDLWPVEADAGQLNQVINNLVINANQAMPSGGTISISAENIIVEKGAALPVAPGPCVKISIRDTGVGIPEENLGRIFDPYFTTKQAGSGLGLSSTYSIMKKHGGHIAVESTVGAGSTFTLYLPAVPEKRPAPPDTLGGPVYGTGRILIIDDDEAVRSVAAKMLSIVGYEVNTARNGKEALETYKERRDAGSPYDVVITDLTLPGGMGGKEIVECLLALDPEARVIVSSGYHDDPILARFENYGFRAAIIKPFTVEKLSIIVARIISQPRRG